MIARGGTPAVRLVPVRAGLPTGAARGACGQIELGDDFDEPLPDSRPTCRDATARRHAHRAVGARRAERLTAAERALLVDPGVERILSAASVWGGGDQARTGQAARTRRTSRRCSPRSSRSPRSTRHCSNRPPSCPVTTPTPSIALLIAQALRDGLTVLTRDEDFAAYGVPLAA